MSSIRIDHEHLAKEVAHIASEVGLSGVIRIDVEGVVACETAYGMAHRAHGIANTIDTQMAMASGSKGFTALVVMSLIESGALSLATTARSILGDDLPLIDDRVTVEQLLAHRSGIGDYLDEELIDNDAYPMPVSVHTLATTEEFLEVLGGYPMKGAPGEQFVYNNGGYVVLALIAERAAGVPFHDLVDQRVLRPAAMTDTAFLRSDELPGRAALGYLDDEGLRTNVFHLPVRGTGDGGAYTTVADMGRFWAGLFSGRIISSDALAEMLRPRSAGNSMRFGLGFWLDETSDTVSLHGFDAGVGFVAACDPHGKFGYTVISNHSRGAWPVSQRIDEVLRSSPQIGDDRR